MLYEARHDAGRRTVWTSNKTPGEIGAFMGTTGWRAGLRAAAGWSS